MSEKQSVFLLDEETKRRLVAVSKEEDRSMSAVLRVLINERYDALFVSIPKVEFPASGKIVYPQKGE